MVCKSERGEAEIKPSPGRWTQLARHLRNGNAQTLEVYSKKAALLWSGPVAAICKPTSAEVASSAPAAPAPGSPPAPPVAPPRPMAPPAMPWPSPPPLGHLPPNMSESLYGFLVTQETQARAMHVYREDVLREQRELLSEVKGILALPLEALARVNDSQAERIAGLERLIFDMLRAYGRPITVGPAKVAEPTPEPEAPSIGSKVGRMIGDIATGAMLKLGENLAGEGQSHDEQKEPAT